MSGMQSCFHIITFALCPPDTRNRFAVENIVATLAWSASCCSVFSPNNHIRFVSTGHAKIGLRSKILSRHSLGALRVALYFLLIITFALCPQDTRM